jgi:NADPH:quinone reductase-like Zn-dependent oxidoreductase
VRVVAAGAHMGDWHICVGEPYLVRVMGFGLRAPTPAVRGTELAGVVDEVGAGVSEWRVGDEVFGFGVGTFAEFAAPRPRSWRRSRRGSRSRRRPCCRSRAPRRCRRSRVGSRRAGTRVLVLGAGGGVGTFAVQLAKADGGRGDRRLFDGEGRPGALARRRPRDRLSPRRRRSRRAARTTS